MFSPASGSAGCCVNSDGEDGFSLHDSANSRVARVVYIEKGSQ